MNFAALLVSLGVMGMVCSSDACDKGCKHTKRFLLPDFKHVPDLQDSSVAPWELKEDSEAGREPAIIRFARCKSCNVEHMIAKPIILQISVYRRARVNDTVAWCKCPFNLAVGCTCVSTQ